MEHEKAYIYGLSDPRDLRIRYVGHTVDLATRLSGHIADNAATPKTQWIAELASLGLQPVMVVLDEVLYNDRFHEEYRWIYLGRARGWDLTNIVAMKTDNYRDIADNTTGKVFVETVPLFSVQLAKSYMCDIFWREGVHVKYVSMRLSAMMIVMYGMMLGVLVSGVGNMVNVISGAPVPAGVAMVGGGFFVLMIASIFGIFLCAPIYVRIRARQIREIRQTLWRLLWVCFMHSQTGYVLLLSDFDRS